MIKEIFKSDIELLLDKELSFGDEWNKDMLLSSFETGRFFVYGYFDKEVLAGYISTSLSVDSADIEDVVVRNDYRRQGIASKLMQYAVKEISDKKIEKVFLEVRESNANAIGLYLKNGFNQIAVRKKYYSDGENAIVMAKEL